jgi:hypothetical protein
MIQSVRGDMQGALASMSSDDALEYAIGQPHARLLSGCHSVHPAATVRII